MKDYLISLYIDDEMNLGEKIDFVQEVSADSALREETISLLRQEILLHESLPAFPKQALNRNASLSEKPSPWHFNFLQNVPTKIAAIVILVLIAFGIGHRYSLSPSHELPATEELYRFVLYDPHTDSVKIIGSFTNWKPISMAPAGKSGYWQISLKISKQEHRYNYITSDGNRITDPTAPLKENDDFGGTDSILDLSATI